MKKIKTLFIAVFGIFLVAAASPTIVSAALPGCGGSDTAVCQTDTNLIDGILKEVINTMLYLAGIIAVIMVIVGGIRYILSDGDSNKANQGKNTIIYALVGLVIAVSAYSIVNFVIGRI